MNTPSYRARYFFIVFLLGFACQSFAAKKPEVPCSKQDESELSDKCVRTYKCPAVVAPKNLNIVGLLVDGELVGSVAVDTKGAFAEVDANLFSGLKEVYFGKDLTASKVDYSVTYDGVETERCYFSYRFNPRAPASRLSLASSAKATNVDLTVNAPTSGETKVFGKTHALCKKAVCEDESEWTLNSLLAVSDLNKNGQKEYWYSFTDGYRKWHKADEFDAKTSQWTTRFYY